ncbi:uncharacterized protein LOC131075381 isoform X2 [Cryptomeria japonica]|uniref:uncharacterized protein LOC131075381 isoform X2 n=1 Tax=Cryptomeria japonica TaxID=3369 RepID=UPI0027DA789B|nr:uncharacterized protein LOC131075381 isoform X2 [Cryptomeria japonica]
MSVSKKQCFQPLINGDFQPASGALSRFRRLNDKTTGEGGRECHGQGRLICLKLKALRLVSIQSRLIVTMARAILGGVLNRGPWAWTTPNNCRGFKVLENARGLPTIT